MTSKSEPGRITRMREELERAEKALEEFERKTKEEAASGYYKLWCKYNRQVLSVPSGVMGIRSLGCPEPELRPMAAALLAPYRSVRPQPPEAQIAEERAATARAKLVAECKLAGALEALEWLSHGSR